MLIPSYTPSKLSFQSTTASRFAVDACRREGISINNSKRLKRHQKPHYSTKNHAVLILSLKSAVNCLLEDLFESQDGVIRSSNSTAVFRQGLLALVCLQLLAPHHIHNEREEGRNQGHSHDRGQQ